MTLRNRCGRTGGRSGTDRAHAGQSIGAAWRARADYRSARRPCARDASARRAGPHARNLCRARDRRSRTRAQASPARAPTFGPAVASSRGFRWAKRAATSPHSLTFSCSGRTTTSASWASGCASSGCQCSGARSSLTLDQKPDRVDRHLAGCQRRDALRFGGVGRRLRRRAKHRARAVRHHFPRRSVRACVLCRRRRSHRTDGARTK